MTTITYTPAADAFETYKKMTFNPAKERFYAENNPMLLEMTRAELITALGTQPSRSETKPELVDRVLAQLWMRTDEQKTYEDLRRADGRESDLIGRAENAASVLQSQMDGLADAVAKRNLPEIDRLADSVHRYGLVVERWQQVAELTTGPNKVAPVEALRQVIADATIKVLDALEDNTEDLRQARTDARWVRRLSYLIEP